MKRPAGSSESRTVRGLVSGRVQGVGFRWFVLQSARRFGVRGTVRNLRDGRVEFVAQGDAKDVERLIESVREGPASSRVDGVETVSLPKTERFDEFMIR